MLSGVSQRARVVLLGVGGGLLAFFVFGGAGLGGKGAPLDPIDAVPRDSFLVATMNLAELRRSPVYEVLLGKDSSGGVIDPRLFGMNKLSAACGFEPLSRVEKLAVAVPEEGDKGELGVAANINVSRDELTKCTSALAEQRGGKVDTKEVGSFVVVERGTGETAAPRLAYGHDMLVVGRGAWFDAMLAAADKKKPSTRDSQGHAALRASLTQRDGWRAPAVVITALLPRSVRERLKNEMTAEAKDNASAIMTGVLGVSAVGFALRTGQNSQSLDAAVELVCEAEDGCGAVEKLLTKKRFEWGKELMYRMVGLGPLLDSIEIKRDGLRIRVTAGAPADQLASTLDRVLRLSKRPYAPEPLPSGPPPLPPRTDETIPAPKPSK